MAENQTGGPSGLAHLRRRWRVIAALGTVGLLIGAAYVLRVPPQLSSTSLVLLTSDSNATSQVDIATEIRIVGSTPVLQAAGKSARPALSAAAVARRVTVDAATPQLIEIRAMSIHADEARSLSQAVAQAYVTMVQGSAQHVAAGTLGELNSRESALTRQLRALEREMSATSERLHKSGPSGVGRRDAQLLAQLTAEQSDLSLQLDKVKEAIAATALTDGAPDPARIIQPASPAVGPSLYRRLLVWGFIGALGGIAVTAGLILIWARRDTRLRARDDLADAVGGSVLADVRSRPQRSVAEWATLFETYKASAVDAWAFRQMLRSLAARDVDGALSDSARAPWRVEHPRSLTVISLAGDSGGLAVGPQLAAFAASLGITTRLVVSVGHSSAAALWAACLADRSSELRPGLLMHGWLRGGSVAESASRHADGQTQPNGVALPRPTYGSALLKPPRGEGRVSPQLVLRSLTGAKGTGKSAPVRGRSAQPDASDGVTRGAPGGAPQVIPGHDPVDFVIVLAVADRKQPNLREVPATMATVLAVSPGVASREELARLAVASDDAGHRLDGVVVADPDPADRTTGRRTMAERVRQAPLPVRLTGLGQIPASPSDRDPSR